MGRIVLKMEADQKYYSWSSFGMHLRKTFQYMLDLSKFNDVTLVCDDQVSISSHKAILSSCSKMFRSIFDFNNCESICSTFTRSSKQFSHVNHQIHLCWRNSAK